MRGFCWLHNAKRISEPNRALPASESRGLERRSSTFPQQTPRSTDSKAVGGSCGQRLCLHPPSALKPPSTMGGRTDRNSVIARHRFIHGMALDAKADTGAPVEEGSHPPEKSGTPAIDRRD